MDKEFVQKLVELYKEGEVSKKAVAQLLRKLESTGAEDIAIIGIGCKIPASDDYRDIWDIMKNRKSQIKQCPKERIYLTAKVMGQDASDESMYHHGAIFGDYEMFDRELFDLNEEEVTLMDPMQRIMLQAAYRGLEDAGYLGKRAQDEVVGVLVGANFTNKQIGNYMLLTGRKDFMAIMSNWTNGVATRISHCFDLRGISTVVENSCIASIMAISEACNLLRAGKITTALVGAVTTTFIPDIRVSLNRVFEHDEYAVSKPYDKNPGGNYVAEGAATLLLKPLKKAIADGDKIHAVIKSSAVNNNGKTSGFTQSNAEMISEVMNAAFTESKISPEDIGYVEGEGYCERLEQALEVLGLCKGFGRLTNRKQYCVLGAASTNLGYSEVAVGIINAICCVMAIKNKQIPPLSMLDVPSDVFDLQNSPFYVNERIKDWTVEEGKKRTAAIFTQGFGGGNGFTILQEYQAEQEERQKQEKNILFISANSEKSFIEYIKRYLDFLDENDELQLEDICYTAACKRRHYTAYRLAVLAKDKDDLYLQLSEYLKNKQCSETLFVSAGQTKNYGENKKHMKDMQDAMRERHYELVAKDYVEGYELEMTELFNEGKFMNVDLPLYPFDAKRYWVW